MKSSRHKTRPGDLIVSDEIALAAFKLKVQGLVRRYIKDKRSGQKTAAERSEDAIGVLAEIVNESAPPAPYRLFVEGAGYVMANDNSTSDHKFTSDYKRAQKFSTISEVGDKCRDLRLRTSLEILNHNAVLAYE